MARRPRCCARSWRARAGPRAERAWAGARACAAPRRNPTDAERLFWHALTRDRRFAGHGFKRQIPVGAHITDIVSFPLRLVIELVPPDEWHQQSRRAPSGGRGSPNADYRVVDVAMTEVEADVGKVLDRLAAVCATSPSVS